MAIAPAPAPALVPVALELTDLTCKWGLVEVFNADGTINRQYRITADEANAVCFGNNVLPPNCTQQEWVSGRVVVTLRCLNPGQCVVLGNGEMWINQGITEANNRVSLALANLDHTEYSIDGAQVQVSTDVVNQLSIPTIEVA